MYSGAGPSMANPLTVQSSVVVNARYDRYFTRHRQKVGSQKVATKYSIGGDTNDENFDVMPRELCFSLRQEFDTNIIRQIRGGDRDREIKIFTSANQLSLFTDADTSKIDPRVARVMMRDQFVFVGVPLTKVLHANMNQPDGVSVQISGSTTIANTGPHEIFVGEYVMWDIPFTDTHATSNTSGLRSAPLAPGLPPGKLCFWTIPQRMAASDDTVTGALNSVSTTTTKDVLDVLKTNAGTKRKRSDAGRAAKPVTIDDLLDQFKHSNSDEDLREVLNFWTNASLRYSHRVIGIALTRAKPGEQMDILLQKCF